MASACKRSDDKPQIDLYPKSKLPSSPAGEAWRYIPASTSKPVVLSGFKTLFGSIGYDDWGFLELRKIILGIPALDLELDLHKPLLEAQVNLPDFRGRTPLHRASSEAMQMLLKSCF